VVFEDGTAIALVACMVAELTLTRMPVCKTHNTVRVYREGKRKALGRKGTCFKLGAITVTAVLATVTVLTYNSYRSFAHLIDQQIAGGYLRSHAGLYAAPRKIEKGARLSKDQLATSLQRAGYAPDKASNIWSGNFQMSENSIRILPRQGTETHQWIDVNFDNRGYIASLSDSDGSGLSSYAL